MSDIGFVGVGNMGRPMAANLVRAGHNVNINDRSREVANNFVQQIGGVMIDAPVSGGANATFQRR